MSYDFHMSIGGDAPESFVMRLGQIISDGRRDEKRWCERLMDEGFAAAHPNDGWVDRANYCFQLVYPHFADTVKVGDKVMLGWHFKPEDERPVIVTKIERGLFGGTKYYFEDMP